jgi:hypothetical protein
MGTAIVAFLVLCIVDIEFADGRHFLALKAIARHLAGRLGFYF